MVIVFLLTMLVAGTGVIRAQEIEINLNPGWNWISYPNAETMAIGDALGDFTPMQGDIIKSQFASSKYIGGRWIGGVTQFVPGKGYQYYSARSVETSFVFAQASSAPVTVITSEPTSVTAISAIGGGEVISNDGSFILAKGLCWATHGYPTTNEDFYLDVGNGVGVITGSMLDLNPNTTYYVRAFAVNVNGTFYGQQKTFSTRDGVPEVSTDSITSILANSVSCLSAVSDDGGLDVTARGVCWSTVPNPTINDDHTVNGSGVGNFISNLTGLIDNTTYYVRAYASNSLGTFYGEEKIFTTLMAVVLDSITDIVGDVANCHGRNNNVCYSRGVCWSTSPHPTTNDSYRLDRHDPCFEEEPCLFDVGGFSVQMGGLDPSTTYYVRVFEIVQNNTTYPYTNTTVYSNEISITTPGETWANGVLPGLFSVNSSRQVNFSKGNLQYQASTNTWRFAINQWSYVGGYVTGDWYYDESGNVYLGSGTKCNNNDVSSSYSGWIDLFGWGTSGYNHGAVCYQPWSTSQSYSDYYAYGAYDNNLIDQNAQADWGYNTISNGGNQPNQWCTLSTEEWKYVFDLRNTTSGIRYAKAKVNNVNGVILLPDDWNASIYNLNNANSGGASFESNVITSEQWNVLEMNGAVFLPNTGMRAYSSDYYYDSWMRLSGIYYWSASYNSDARAWHVNVGDSYVYSQDYSRRSNGFGVRLVRYTHQMESPTVTTTDVSTTAMPSVVTCGGEVVSDGGSDVTSRGVCWSTSPNPTIADAHSVDGRGLGSFSSVITALMPNTTYYVRAYAANRYYTSYGNEVSFTTINATGKLPGVFSVSDSQQVNFSQGNLQYKASTNTWRFAEHQYDCIGSSNSNISSTYDGWIDLFGWGTSGYNHGAYCYQPWSTSQNDQNYYAYGNYNNSLSDQTGQADWGYNAISNGGNQECSGWRSLTSAEWYYILNTRSTPSGIRYAKARVNNLNGMVLLPDDWDSNYYYLSCTNDWRANFSSNLISASQWSTLELHGAVFLPAAGYRYGTSVYSVDGDGFYWSSTCSTNYETLCFHFYDSSFLSQFGFWRYVGQSVRLVIPFED